MNGVVEVVVVVVVVVVIVVVIVVVVVVILVVVVVVVVVAVLLLLYHHPPPYNNDCLQKLVARVEPTLPQLPASQDGRPGPNAPTGLQSKTYQLEMGGGGGAGGTLPHLKQGGESHLTRQTAFLQPKDVQRDKAAAAAAASLRKSEEYSSHLPITPQGTGLSVHRL